MNPENEKKIPDDEIDFGRLGNKLYSFLSYPFTLLGSHKIITLGFIVLGILSAAAIKYSGTKTYSSSFIIHPADRTERVHLKMLSNIQLLLKYRDFNSIANELRVDSLVSQKLVALQTSNASLKNPLDSVNNTEVTITTTDYTQFIPIQNALLNYLEGNPYFAKIREMQKKQVAMELEQVEKDLVQLDSLKLLQQRTYGKQNFPAQSTILLKDLMDPMAVYATSMDRISRRSNLIARGVFTDNFYIVKPCVVIRKATSPPRILILCIYTVPLFLVACVMFLHFRNRSKKINPSQNL